MYTIAIVDDDKFLLDELEACLRGYNVEKYYCPMEFIDNINSNGLDKIDLLILDMMMRGISGDILAENLCNNKAMKNIPVLFLSGVYEEAVIKRAYQACNKTLAVDYMIKPVSTLWFLEKVKNFLKLKKYYDDMNKANEEMAEINFDMIYLIKNFVSNNKDLKSKLDKHRTNEQRIYHLSKQLELVKKLISRIASNDIPLLKFVLIVIEKNKEVIDCIVKEASEDEELFRVLTKTIEPLQTAISDIEQVLRIFVDMRIIDSISVIEDDLKKSSFYFILDSIYIKGGFSPNLFESFLELAKVSYEDSRIIEF